MSNLTYITISIYDIQECEDVDKLGQMYYDLMLTVSACLEEMTEIEYHSKEFKRMQGVIARSKFLQEQCKARVARILNEGQRINHNFREDAKKMLSPETYNAIYESASRPQSARKAEASGI